MRTIPWYIIELHMPSDSNSHADDVNCLVVGRHVFATCSFDGVTNIWSKESLVILYSVRPKVTDKYTGSKSIDAVCGLKNVRIRSY